MLDGLGLQMPLMKIILMLLRVVVRAAAWPRWKALGAILGAVISILLGLRRVRVAWKVVANLLRSVTYETVLLISMVLKCWLSWKLCTLLRMKWYLGPSLSVRLSTVGSRLSLAMLKCVPRPKVPPLFL